MTESVIRLKTSLTTERILERVVRDVRSDGIMAHLLGGLVGRDTRNDGFSLKWRSGSEIPDCDIIGDISDVGSHRVVTLRFQEGSCFAVHHTPKAVIDEVVAVVCRAVSGEKQT